MKEPIYHPLAALEFDNKKCVSVSPVFSSQCVIGGFESDSPAVSITVLLFPVQSVAELQSVNKRFASLIT